MTEGPTGLFGVYSVPSADYGAEGAVETLYNVQNGEFEAAVWMGRYIVFRAFHLIPYEDFHRLATTLERVVEERRFNTTVRCADVMYYVRALTMAEVGEIIKLDSDEPQ